MHLHRPQDLKVALRLSWQDAGLAGITVAWAVMPKAMVFFHFYTIGVMVLVLSIGVTRGLWAALSRGGVASLLVLIVAAFGPMRHLMGMEVVSMLGCGVFAGLLGESQRRSREALKRSFFDTLQVLSRALEARDPYTEGHTRRTARYAIQMADAMGVPWEAQVAIEQAGLLHDLGKIGTPDAVLGKQGALTAGEQEQMRRHPVVGGKILEGVEFLAAAANLVRHHHEHFDGSGYPDGLSGNAIPLGAKIMAVADALDAMTTDRPYHKAVTLGEAILEVERGSGGQFDPDVVSALKRACLEKIRGEGS